MKSHSRNIMFAVLTAACSMSFTATASATDETISVRSITQSALNALCYAAAEDTNAAYHAQATRFGVSRLDLAKLEKSADCNGIKLGQVESNWRKRNAA